MAPKRKIETKPASSCKGWKCPGRAVSGCGFCTRCCRDLHGQLAPDMRDAKRCREPGPGAIFTPCGNCNGFGSFLDGSRCSACGGLKGRWS